MKFARLLLRVIVGALFVGHGTQKLFGWFGGYGLDATAKGFESMGARPGRLNAIAASSTEVGGGTLLALGLATPLAASGLISVMLTAINRVHRKKGIWNTDGGYEYNLVLIATLVALTETGPGPLSFDRDRLSGPGWALAALLGGIAGAAGAHAYSAAQPEPQPQAAAPTRETTPEPEPVEARER